MYIYLPFFTLLMVPIDETPKNEKDICKLTSLDTDITTISNR